jgi:hypothetical protein
MYCFRCVTEIALAGDRKVGRKEECPKCGADLHVCKNCIHFDVKAYNECRESSADRVLDKDKSNFCDYFSPTENKPGSPALSRTGSAKKKLDDLFK